MTDDNSEMGKRSKRIYIYWGVALTLLIAAGLFSWLVVVPVWQVRRHVQYCYQAVLTEEARANTIEQLGGPQPAVRKISLYLRMPEKIAPHRAVAVSLYGYCGPGAVDKLLPFMDSPDMQSIAALALGRIGPEARVAVPALVPLLGSKNVWARLHSAEALYRITGEVDRVGPVLLAIVEDTDIAVSAEGIRVLSSMGTKGIPFAVRGFASRNWKVRAALAMLVVFTGRSDPMVVDILGKALRNPDPLIRCCSAACIGRIGSSNRQVNTRLVSLLDDEHPYVRRAAAEALGQLGIVDSRARLTKLLSDKDESVRKAAAEALEKIRGGTPSSAHHPGAQ